VKLLVAPHELNIGGSQINAIDLAAAVAAEGHEVLVYGVPGPLVEYIEASGLEFVPARRLRYRPAPSRIAQLAALARSRELDLIHAYEWPPCLDAYFGAHLGLGVPVVCSVLSMAVSPYVPASIPLIMGTEALAEEARRGHAGPVWALEPPIDTTADHPFVDGSGFRRAHGVADDALLVVTVSRLAIDLKLDALVRAIDAVDLLNARLPVRLIVVGGGEAQGPLTERAIGVNARRGPDVINFAGSMRDPRPAYAAADVVMGMGSSSLRAMSIGRPVIVQGERGFSRIFEPASLDYFLHHGFWGIGSDEPTAERLAAQLRSLLCDGTRRAELGAFGRRTVEQRLSLRRALAMQLELYERVLALRRERRAADARTAALRALRLEVENHDPRRKRRRAERERSLLEAARRQVAEPAPEPALEASG
jgi:glycosyltransferase involved in cell wall biosynthesis